MFIFSLIKSAKLVGLLAGLVSIVVGFFAITSHYESAGYDRAVKEIQEESGKAIAKATQEAITDAEVKIKKKLSQQRQLFDAELLRAKSESTTTKEIEYVEKQVESIVYIAGQCEFTTSDVELLNKAIHSANQAARD